MATDPERDTDDKKTYRRRTFGSYIFKTGTIDSYAFQPASSNSKRSFKNWLFRRGSKKPSEDGSFRLNAKRQNTWSTTPSGLDPGTLESFRDFYRRNAATAMIEAEELDKQNALLKMIQEGQEKEVQQETPERSNHFEEEAAVNPLDESQAAYSRPDSREFKKGRTTMTMSTADSLKACAALENHARRYYCLKIVHASNMILALNIFF